MSDYLDHLITGADHSQSNIFGGEDHYNAAGQKIASTHQNIFGGHDMYDPVGHKIASSHATHSGTDVYLGAQKVISSQMTMGGEYITGAGGAHLGTFHHDVNGVTFQDPMGQFHSWKHNLMGGFNADPLQNMGGIRFPSFF